MPLETYCFHLQDINREDPHYNSDTGAQSQPWDEHIAPPSIEVT